MKHREDIWGRTQALIGRPFIYANGSLFYGEPGKHHHEILEQHPEINDLWQYPGTLAAGRVWPEQNNYWTPTGDNEEVRQALENEFSKEHSGSHQKVAIKYKYVYDQDTGRIALTKPYQYEDRHHSDLFRELGEPTGSVAAGTYNPSTGVHYMWGSDDIPKDEVERAIQKQIGSHLGASENNVQKYVWFDGKMIVTPPQYMHDEPYHATLAQDVGYRWDDPNATIEFGYYFPDDDSLRAYHEKGQGLPAEQELKEFIRAHPKGNLETVFPQLSDESVHSARAKQAALHKFVWADGKFAVTPNIQHDPGLMHHGDLVDELGFGDSFGPMAQNIVAGEYYYPGNMEIIYQRGEHPDKSQLAYLVQTTEPVPLYSNSPTKQAVALFPFHKYVWADGKIAVGPRVETDSVRPWHTDLMSGMGYDYQTNMPEEWNVGYYYPHDHSTYEIDSTENVPDEYSIVKQIHNHLEDGDVHAPRSSGRAVYHEYECQAANYFFDTM